MEKYRRAETLRLIDWINNHNEEWKDICLLLTEEDVLIPEECRDLIRILKNNHFYQLLVAIAYGENKYIHQAIEGSILSELKRNWSDEMLDKTLDTLLDNIVRL